MISHKHKFIFIGISKAASGSVRKTFMTFTISMHMDQNVMEIHTMFTMVPIILKNILIERVGIGTTTFRLHL